jgi:hypothetical protein
VLLDHGDAEGQCDQVIPSSFICGRIDFIEQVCVVLLSEPTPSGRGQIERVREAQFASRRSGGRAEELVSVDQSGDQARLPLSQQG